MMINTWNVASIYNYEDAQNYFDSTRYPARSKKWFEHQRPLRNTQSPHLRIEKGEHAGVQFYDLVLYQTALVRYFEPNDKGERAVWLLNHYSNSSQRFLLNAGWHSRKKLTTDANVEFPLQLSTQSGLAQTIWGDEFTCKLVFNAEGKVIVDKSVHIPFARRVSTTTHRAKRKQLRERLNMIFDMLEMQYQSFISEIVIDEREGKPFSSRSSGRATQDAIDKLRTADFDSLSPDDMTSLVHFGMGSCREIAHSIANRRAYNYTFPEQYRNLSWEALREVRMSGLLPCDDKPLSEHSPEVQQALTPTWEDIRKAVELDFQHLAGLQRGDQFKPYPQFAPKVARSCWSVGGKHEDLPNLFGIETYHKLTNRKGVVY